MPIKRDQSAVLIARYLQLYSESQVRRNVGQQGHENVHIAKLSLIFTPAIGL